MKSIVQETYGSTETLELRDVERPQIADDEVLVRVVAAGVDRGVWHLMTGLPYPIRLAGYGFSAPKRANPGMDVAGVVETVGKDVTRFAPGDEVFGVGRSTFAEYAVAPEKKLAPKPAALSFEQAAAVPISGLTALQAVRDHGKVEAGQKVLVIGASGGVGSYAVQLAKAFGAEVTGVCSPSKVDLVRTLGADHVIDYSTEDFADHAGEYDVILDIGGNAKLKRLRRALSPTGTLVFVGGETGGKWLGGMQRQIGASLTSVFARQDLKMFVSKENHEDLLALTELIESGKVTPAVERTYPLSETAKAIRHMEEGHARGKLVITV